MEVVKTIASHVAVIDAGRIVEAGRTFDVHTNPSTRRRARCSAPRR